MGLLDNISKGPSFSVEQRSCLNGTPNPQTTASGWQQWHVSLTRCFGRAGANDLWVLAWDRYGRENSNAYSTSLAQYMSRQGVQITQGSLEAISLTGANFVSGVGGYFNAIKIVNIAVVGGIAIGFLMLLYTLILNPDKAKKTLNVVTEGAMLASPQGRAVKAIQG